MYKNSPRYFFILVFVLICASCNNSQLETKYTEELSYRLNDAGTGYYVSNGTNVDTIVNVPSFYNGLPVIGVDYSGFSYSNHMIEFEEVNLPETVIEIKNSAFAYCEKLKDFNFPNSLEIIGENAFSHCKSLEKVILPDSVKVIGQQAFDSLASVKEFRFPNSLEFTSYIKSGYANNFSLSILSNYHEGGFYFGSLENPYMILDTINTNNNELVVNKNCKFIAISDNLTDVKIEKLYLSDNVEYISSKVTITGLKQIIGDCKIKGISHNTFAYNRGLVEIPTLEFCEFIRYSAFEECKKLSGKIDLSSIEELGKQAFYNCENIEEVIIGKQLESIEMNTFYNCKNLRNIYIPKNLKYIEYNAFYHCVGLEKIYFEGSKEEWNEINISASNLDYINNASIIFDYAY